MLFERICCIYPFVKLALEELTEELPEELPDKPLIGDLNSTANSAQINSIPTNIQKLPKYCRLYISTISFLRVYAPCRPV